MGNPLSLILIGVVLMVGGTGVLFLNVIGLVPASLMLSAGAYLANTIGFFIGNIGVVGYVRGRRDGG